MIVFYVLNPPETIVNTYQTNCVCQSLQTLRKCVFSGLGRNVPSSHTGFPWGRIIYTQHLKDEVGSIWWVQKQEVSSTA